MVQCYSNRCLYGYDLGKRKSYAPGENQVSVLNFFFRPYERGMYNYSQSKDVNGNYNYSRIIDSTFQQNHREQTWGGCQLVLGTNSTNLQDQNINFIEMWVNVQQCDAARTAKLNIDLGYISEDVNANKRLDTEDGLGTINRTGILDPKNDVGLDSLWDDQEKNVYSSFIKNILQYMPIHPAMIGKYRRTVDIVHQTLRETGMDVLERKEIPIVLPAIFRTLKI